MKVTRQELEKMTKLLNEREGRPVTATRRFDDKTLWNIGHILLDHAAIYGGYALREIQENGGEAFYYPQWTRITAREMFAFLEGRLGV